MTDQSFPITPPPELVGQWASKSFVTQHLCTAVAQWGADQELEACCEWIHDWYGNGSGEVVGNLRAARRPKPPSLKEQALDALEQVEADFNTGSFGDTIRRALEALPND